jgi:hypothetical protein
MQNGIVHVTSVKICNLFKKDISDLNLKKATVNAGIGVI